MNFLIPPFKESAIEIGWPGAASLARGTAPRGAGSVEYRFTKLGIDQIVVFTTFLTVRSLRVMEKIGMMRAPSSRFRITQECLDLTGSASRLSTFSRLVHVSIAAPGVPVSLHHSNPIKVL
jgi:hypothetical protein